jgi:7,8-dihydropterin-6-yl-methyl-4-(beta-D-ribofuranosyl)aminobenzene 5'-phosphate synthase
MKNILCYLLVSLVVLVLGSGILLWRRFVTGKQRAEALWQQSTVSRIKNLGATQSLEILPLIDWRTSRDDLKGEAGVAYLIKTDATTILFDLGLNLKNEHPSPLLHNMEQLGIALEDFDTIVISHNHLDHVGGMAWSRRKTFSLTNHQIDLGAKTAYTPIPMTYPGLDPIHAPEPTVIAKGVATIGTITSQDYFMGWIEEQAIAVNVAGKGIVVITGCGHPTLPKILERITALFDEPIYGVIGGYHFPVTDAHTKVLGIGVQRYVGTGKPPWDPITLDEVGENIQILQQHGPQLVALSPHDSCEASIAAFRCVC